MNIETHRTRFDLTGPLPAGRAALEASAGTGKTYSLTALIARYIAEASVPADQILVVTFTRAAADELRTRARAVLAAAAEALLPDNVSAGITPKGNDWMTVLQQCDNLFEPAHRRQRVATAISRFDDITITTIHGFCQSALGQLGLRAGTDPAAVLVENTTDLVAEVCRDALLDALADDPTWLMSPTGKPRTPKQFERDLIDIVKGVLTNPSATVVPTQVEDDIAMRWADLVDRSRQTVHDRQARRGQTGYDSLVTGLHRALTDPRRGRQVAAQLAQRFSVVLIDEFQDTDQLQWDVFRLAFGSKTLVTVGDPKQAIYRFRGADVDAYLAAVADVPASSTLSLATNFRSDRALLDGLGHLFDGATLGDARIAFHPVAAAESAPHNALRSPTDPPGAAAVRLRAVPLDPRLKSPMRKTLSMPLVRGLILSDLASRVIELLDHGIISDRSGSERRVLPGDIAVLVPTHAEAHHVADALQRSGVPAVRTRTGSVLASPAVLQWRLLLTALARPHDVGAVRAAALGWFLATDVAMLAGDAGHDDANDGDDVVTHLHEQAATMADHLRRDGIAAFYDAQKAGPGLLETVLGLPDGVRHLTDLDHIAELLAAALHATSSDANGAISVLEDLVSNDDDRAEATMRRIDSDDLAVQITTIHAAKGLEFPIVLVPFSFKPRPNTRVPYSYSDSHGHRMIDVASPIAWDGGPSTPGDETTRDNQELRKYLTGTDNDGDALRLLYVALTRAQHRLEIWWASTMSAKTSALARLLLDRDDGSSPVRNSPAELRPKRGGVGISIKPPDFTKLDEDPAHKQVCAVAEGSDGAISYIEIPPMLDHPVWTNRVSVHPVAMSTPSTGRRSLLDPTWKRWSFTRLGATVDAAIHQRDLAPPLPGEPLLAQPIDAALDHEAAGRADETPDLHDDMIAIEARTGPDPESESKSEPATVPDGVSMHLADTAAGTTFGTFVHSVLEGLDFTSADLDTDLHAHALEHAAIAGLSIPLEPVVAGVAAALRTPLGPLFDNRRLVDFAPADRLAELTFDLPILAATVTSSPIRAGDIGRVLLATLDDGDPVRDFATQMIDSFDAVDISGWMHGSIDAVLRIAGPLGHRYVVIDYKTNRLHVPGQSDPLSAYAPPLLVAAMEHHRYPLQALIYSVALHRYLRWRLGDRYAPDVHLGGVGYLFVRGMVGPDTPLTDGRPAGVFAWRPATAAIVGLDHLLAVGTSA